MAYVVWSFFVWGKRKIPDTVFGQYPGKMYSSKYVFLFCVK